MSEKIYCSEPDCKNVVHVDGKCQKHAYGICSEIGCSNLVKVKGKCRKHAYGKCIIDNCDNYACNPDKLCTIHYKKKYPNGKPKKKPREKEICSEIGCSNIAQTKDKCIKHAYGKCIIDGCDNYACGSDKICQIHKYEKKKIFCSVLECSKIAKVKGKCQKHAYGECEVENCDNVVQFKGKCYRHAGKKRCPNCIDWIDSRQGDPSYDGYCATCFKHLFPKDPRGTKKYEKSKELRVRNEINKNFNKKNGYEFIHDTKLYTGNCDCTHRRRIDHRILINNTILAIETDEFAHRSYKKDDEEIRYDDVYMIHSGKWIFIRFNPDSNRDKTDFSDKLIKLKETIENSIYRIENDLNDDLVEIIKLYY